MIFVRVNGRMQWFFSTCARVLTKSHIHTHKHIRRTRTGERITFAKLNWAEERRKKKNYLQRFGPISLFLYPNVLLHLYTQNPSWSNGQDVLCASADPGIDTKENFHFTQQQMPSIRCCHHSLTGRPSFMPNAHFKLLYCVVGKRGSSCWIIRLGDTHAG